MANNNDRQPRDAEAVIELVREAYEEGWFEDAIPGARPGGDPQASLEYLRSLVPEQYRERITIEGVAPPAPPPVGYVPEAPLPPAPPPPPPPPPEPTTMGPALALGAAAAVIGGIGLLGAVAVGGIWMARRRR